MIDPVKIAFGEFMTEFYNSIAPTNDIINEFANRGVGKSIAWCPARMIDEAEEMLATWRNNDTDNSDTNPIKMPVLLVAMSKDYMPSASDFSGQVTTPISIGIDTDTKDRHFKLRLTTTDIRAQIVIFARESETAYQLANQFCLFLSDPSNRRFYADFKFAGESNKYPVLLESNDSPASSVDTTHKNLSILAVDLTLKPTIPLYQAPKNNEPNDGKGSASLNDPSGYPVVLEENTEQNFSQ